MKNLFEISSEEKNRILEMHINATKRQYLFEEKKSLSITVTDESGEKIPYAAIIDLGDKTNGVITDNNGFGILNNFVGPSFETSSVGMSNEVITPENGKNDITVVMKQSGTLKTLEIGVKSYFGKIVDSETNKPISGAKIEGLYVSDDFSGYTWTSDDKGMFESGIKYENLIIKADGYDELKYKPNLSELGSKEKPNIIKLTKTVIPKETPDELKYLIGKTYVFEDKNLKEPKTYKINDAQYIDNDGYITVELSVSEEELKETDYVIFECGRVIFQGYKKNEKGKRSIGKNYFYQRDLSEYLLNKTKCCNKIENNNKK